jgi:hypothetical protein
VRLTIEIDLDQLPDAMAGFGRSRRRALDTGSDEEGSVRFSSSRLPEMLPAVRTVAAAIDAELGNPPRRQADD